MQPAKIHENSNHSHTCVVPSPKRRMNESCAQSLKITRSTSIGPKFFEDGLIFIFCTYHCIAGHFHNNQDRDRVWARGFVQLSQFRGWFSWLTEEPEDEEALSGKCF